MEGDLQTVVGHNVRRIRMATGYSQEEFGDYIGWHRTWVGALERGERNVTLKTLERLCQQLGMHPLDLLWAEEDIAVTLASGATLALAPGDDDDDGDGDGDEDRDAPR